MQLSQSFQRTFNCTLSLCETDSW